MFSKFGFKNFHKCLSDDSGLKHHLSTIKPSFATAVCLINPSINSITFLIDVFDTTLYGSSIVRHYWSLMNLTLCKAINWIFRIPKRHFSGVLKFTHVRVHNVFILFAQYDILYMSRKIDIFLHPRKSLTDFVEI